MALKAYVDDVDAACKAENIGSVITCFRTAAKEQGMTINMSKLKIWGVPKGALPEEFRAHHVDVLPLTMSWAIQLPAQIAACTWLPWVTNVEPSTRSRMLCRALLRG